MKHFSTANMLDRAILSVSPRRGLDRITAKSRARILMNYDGASQGRRLKAWKAPATDADAASLGGRKLLRQRSRDMVRNSPFAARAQSTIAGGIVGSGIVPSVTSAKSKASKADAERRIIGHLKSKELDFNGDLDLFAMQEVVANSVFESGEILARRVKTKTTKNRLLPFQIQLLEVDHLDPTITSYGGNEVIDGIEYSDAGRALAFHIYEKHPGSATRKMTMKSHRVPASEIIHVRRISRAGQVRGVSWLAPVMVTLGELRDYQEAQILKQKMSALLAGVVQREDGSNIPEGASGLDQLSPGALLHAEPGETINWLNPPTVDDYDVVMRLGLMAIAMGLGITYESLSGDLSRVNFSSARMGRIEMDRNIDVWQRRILIGQFCEGVAKWALDAWRLTPGSMVKEAQLGWTAPTRAMIDPNKELKPVVQKIEAGLSSRQREIRNLGHDPDVIDRERREDEERDAAHGAQPNPQPKKGVTK